MPGGIKKRSGPRAPRKASAAGPTGENETMAAFDIQGLCMKEGKSPGTGVAVFDVGSRSGQETKAPITILACLEPMNNFSFRIDSMGDMGFLYDYSIPSLFLFALVIEGASILVFLRMKNRIDSLKAQ